MILSHAVLASALAWCLPQTEVSPPLPAAATAALEEWHPSNAEEWREHFGVDSIFYESWGSLELWSDDKKTFEELKKALDTAWPITCELLGGNPMPAGGVIRVIASDEEETLKSYWPLLCEGAQLAGIAAPPSYLLAGVNSVGSAHWNLPPTVMLNSKAESLKTLPTRAVHEVAVLAVGWASSWSGYGTPEFLKEGFAGMVERRALEKPAALVYHERAALESTIHGYGVFSGIGEAMNDSSNAPDNWPRLIHNAVKKMNKELKSSSKRAKIDPEQRIDALLLRNKAAFARADYAYAWATMEFLFAQPQEGEEGTDRRAALHSVLAELRHARHAALDQDKRSKLFLELLLREHEQDGAALHLEFLAWSTESLPSK